MSPTVDFLNLTASFWLSDAILRSLYWLHSLLSLKMISDGYRNGVIEDILRVKINESQESFENKRQLSLTVVCLQYIICLTRQEYEVIMITDIAKHKESFRTNVIVPFLLLNNNSRHFVSFALFLAKLLTQAFICFQWWCEYKGCYSWFMWRSSFEQKQLEFRGHIFLYWNYLWCHTKEASFSARVTHVILGTQLIRHNCSVIKSIWFNVVSLPFKSSQFSDCNNSMKGVLTQVFLKRVEDTSCLLLSPSRYALMRAIILEKISTSNESQTLPVSHSDVKHSGFETCNCFAR